MFKGETRQGDLNGFLDHGSHIQGDLLFDDTFRIDGRVTGSVKSEGELIVGERGQVEGDILVARVYVCGRVLGRIDASERLEIAKGAKVEGEIAATRLIIEEGAFFEGTCKMREQGENAKVTSMAARKS